MKYIVVKEVYDMERLLSKVPMTMVFDTKKKAEKALKEDWTMMKEYGDYTNIRCMKSVRHSHKTVKSYIYKCLGHREISNTMLDLGLSYNGNNDTALYYRRSFIIKYDIILCEEEGAE